MKDSRIKVIHIVGNARIGGVAAFLLNYFRRADTSRYRFDFVTYAKCDFDDAVHSVDPTSRIYYIPSFQKSPFSAMRALKKIYRSEDYSAVHSHMTTLSAFALPPAKAAGIPVRICHAHSAFDKHSDHYIVKKLLRPFAAKKATALAACSMHAAQNLFGKRAQETFILPNAIPAARFYCSAEERAAAKERLGLQEKAVLFVGRFVYQKNLFFLLEAFALAHRERPMTLLLVGGGTDEAALKERTKTLGIAESVRFIPPCDPAPYYKAADTFALPSRYEGLGMVAVEAQAAGVPCILSDAVPKEADISGACIFLPANGESDVAVWAKALAKDMPHIGNARAAVERAGYDIEKEAHRMTDLYDCLLQKKS